MRLEAHFKRQGRWFIVSNGSVVDKAILDALKLLSFISHNPGYNERGYKGLNTIVLVSRIIETDDSKLIRIFGATIFML